MCDSFFFFFGKTNPPAGLVPRRRGSGVSTRYMTKMERVLKDAWEAGGKRYGDKQRHEGCACLCGWAGFQNS